MLSKQHHCNQVVPGVRIRLACVGTKGDWVFIRKDSWSLTNHIFCFDFSKFYRSIYVTGSSFKYFISTNLIRIQAFHMNCGFNCLKKCHLCDADDWHNMSQGASWRQTCGVHRNGSPFWIRADQIPLLSIPGMNKDNILPDSLHCFHLGWGQDLGASGIVLLAKLGYFNGHTLNDKLADAYGIFSGWVTRNHKTTGIDWWSKLKLDMASTLCFCMWRFCVISGLKDCWKTWCDTNYMYATCPRDNDWPTSLGSCNGKAYDTAVALSWLEDFLATIEPLRNNRQFWFFWGDVTVISSFHLQKIQLGLFRWRLASRIKGCSDVKQQVFSHFANMWNVVGWASQVWSFEGWYIDVRALLKSWSHQHLDVVFVVV